MNQSKDTIQRFSKRNFFKPIRWMTFAILLGLLFIAVIDLYVGSFSRGRLYRAVGEVPHRRAALVLGCSKYTRGRLNSYYQHRINAATELWQAGKIDAIVVSGDNSRKDYDEPSEMKADLVKKGVPGEYITLDFAGFRTLDSVIRADQVFGLEDYVIVSQPFHCRRAIYLARQQNQVAIGYCAGDVSGSSGLKVRLREVLARAKAVVDILISQPPKYLGEQEPVNYRFTEEDRF